MKIVQFILAISLSINLFAQDTTWVQTFTYDSISTRRANFDFPAELNTMRFEKVLMYYNLKCDPLTPYDSYNCGEWDYLAYTRVFDHTGFYDSVQVDGVSYQSNFQSPGIYNYDPYTGNKVDEYVRIESFRTGSSATLNSVIPNLGSVNSLPFDLAYNGNRNQIIVSATELIAAGVVAGDLQTLSLFVNTITGNGEVHYPSISIKATTDTDLTEFHTTGFSEVYNYSKSAALGGEFVGGENELIFYQPFTWNGTDNLIIEFNFESGTGLQTNSVLFEEGVTIPNQSINYSGRNGVMSFDGTNHSMIELSDFDLGNALTISFWAKGNGNTGVNTSILEGYDTLNNRIINIHMPWSNNRIYWDCGEGSGYDRIDQDMSTAGIDNEWHHWAFVKDQSTGEMKIFRDGVVWHSGTGLTRSIGDLHRLVIGSNRSIANNWKGSIDEFQIYNVAVDDATINSWYTKRIDNSHPNWNDLLVYYSFDDENVANDISNNSYLLMPSAKGMINFTEYPLVGIEQVNRPQLSIGQGVVSGSQMDVDVPFYSLKEPDVVFEYSQVNRHFEISNAFLSDPEGSEIVYNSNLDTLSETPYSVSNALSNSTITYYELPFELINDVEIGRFITPYGIGFDLGPNGFTWIYDVTDYQQYLKNTVDLAAHNTQELIDVKFAFIEGIPPRDVHARQPIWSDFRSYSYGSMDDDIVLQSTDVELADSSSMFKIKTRFTGHGHNGNVNCCEWDSKDHMISIDGTERFNWEIWEESACGDSPNPEQGGTWPYAREGWCPGDLVKEYDHDLTPFVTPGATVSIDYDIEDVPAGDQDQAIGNYIVAMDLISYSSPNHQYDAAISEVLNPNKWEYFRKWNPSCQNPRVIIQNTGEQTLTSCVITIYISEAHPYNYTWTGSLDFLEKEVVEIAVPSINWWNNEHPELNFTAEITSINGGANPDEYTNNNKKVVPFDAPDYIEGEFLVWFVTNNRPNENQWRLEDESGNIIYQATSFAASTTYKDTFNLEEGCYSIIIEDSDSDGLGYWYSNQYEGETNGTFRLKKVGGSYIEFFPRDFGNYHRYNFSVGKELGLDEDNLNHEIMLFPNPVDNLLNIELSGFVDGNAHLEVYNMLGKLVHSGEMNASNSFASSELNTSDLHSGQYIVRITTKSQVYTSEFIKN